MNKFVLLCFVLHCFVSHCFVLLCFQNVLFCFALLCFVLSFSLSHSVVRLVGVALLSLAWEPPSMHGTLAIVDLSSEERCRAPRE